ncbi:hypothetical protein BDR07DRAFT_1226279, partial [Suillus spraguei]
FRELTVLIAGNFHQFPPVRNINRALYSQFPRTSCCQLGKNIYEQFTTVVTLQRQMQIVDAAWNEILGRAREGECTLTDLDEIRCLMLFNERCNRPDVSTSPWNDVILITPQNSMQTWWNACAVAKHSAESGSMLYLFPTEDSMHVMHLSKSQCLAVAHLTLKQTEHLPKILHLIRGMHIMVTRNIAVCANLSNGFRGRVVDIVLDSREPAL